MEKKKLCTHCSHEKTKQNEIHPMIKQPVQTSVALHVVFFCMGLSVSCVVIREILAHFSEQCCFNLLSWVGFCFCTDFLRPHHNISIRFFSHSVADLLLFGIIVLFMTQLHMRPSVMQMISHSATEYVRIHPRWQWTARRHMPEAVEPTLNHYTSTSAIGSCFETLLLYHVFISPKRHSSHLCWIAWLFEM